MNSQEKYATLGIDIGSTTVKIAILDEEHNILFSDYERHSGGRSRGYFPAGTGSQDRCCHRAGR